MCQKEPSLFAHIDRLSAFRRDYMKMRNHRKKVLKAISIAILAVVLAFTNFAGLFPANVYAETQVVNRE